MVTVNHYENGNGSTRAISCRRIWLLVLFVLTIEPFLCGSAWAQSKEAGDAAKAAERQQIGYKELPVDENLRRNYIIINQMLMSGKFSPGQQTEFDDYYQKYLLPRWTELKNIANLPSYRKELRNNLGKRSADVQVHDHLNALTLNFMKDLIAGPYHPATQINAMLMIGELNSVEQPPTLLPEALLLMVAAVGSEKVSDAVRAAAMVGIERHATAGIADQDVRKTLIATLVKIADGELPTGSASAGRQWILGQTFETLATLGALGDGNAVFKAILKNVNDHKLSSTTRAIAAASLGRFNYTGANGIDPAEAAAVLGQFIVDVCAEELGTAKDNNEPIAPQRILQCLTAVQKALNGDGEANHKGIASLAKTQNQKTLVEGLRKNIEGMIAEIDKWREGDNLTDSVDKLQGDVEELLKKN